MQLEQQHNTARAGQKIQRAAAAKGVDPGSFCDEVLAAVERKYTSIFLHASRTLSACIMRTRILSNHCMHTHVHLVGLRAGFHYISHLLRFVQYFLRRLHQVYTYKYRHK